MFSIQQNNPNFPTNVATQENNWGKEGVIQEITSLISQNQKTIYLSLHDKNWKFDSKFLNDEGMVFLIEYLKKDHFFTKLKINIYSKNNNEQIKYLPKIIKVTSSIYSLEISGLNLPHEIWEEIASSLAEHTTITDLCSFATRPQGILHCIEKIGEANWNKIYSNKNFRSNNNWKEKTIKLANELQENKFTILSKVKPFARLNKEICGSVEAAVKYILIHERLYKMEEFDSLLFSLKESFQTNWLQLIALRNHGLFALLPKDIIKAIGKWLHPKDILWTDRIKGEILQEAKVAKLM
jgi:hypothetical protein